MNINEQAIIKGSIVESRQHNWQGIVTQVRPSLWKKEISEDTIREFMAMRKPAITDEQATNERWVYGSNFSSMVFMAPESDLFIIPITKVRFGEFPCAFHGKITDVKQSGGSVILTMRTNRSQGTECRGYSDTVTINNPTVYPFIGDQIFGTQDFVIIHADGLDYPYILNNSAIWQDW